MEQQKAPSQQRNHWPKYDKTLGIQKGTRAPEQQQQGVVIEWYFVVQGSTGVVQSSICSTE